MAVDFSVAAAPRIDSLFFSCTNINSGPYPASTGNCAGQSNRRAIIDYSVVFLTIVDRLVTALVRNQPTRSSNKRTGTTVLW